MPPQSHAQEPLPFPPPEAATVFDALVCLHCGARFLACVCFEGDREHGRVA